MKKISQYNHLASRFSSLARLASAAFCSFAFLANGQTLPEPVAEVSPMVGTGGHGHTYPGATVPFGFVQVSPDTRTKGWDGCSGYHYTDSTIEGFSHTHLSGTGGADLGDILFLPMTGELNGSSNYQPIDSERFKSKFSHDQEYAEPGYYRVMLDTYGIRAELTATAHAAMHRYIFPASAQSHILIDLVHGIGSHPTDAELKVEGTNVITGWRRVDGWAKGRMLFFVAECSRPFKSCGFEGEGKPLADNETDAHGKNLRAHLDFETSQGEQIVLRIGFSPTSVAEARKNLAAEISSWDFDAVRDSARSAWNENLSRIRIESPDPDVRRVFYTALYHAMVSPTLYNDADGNYRGADNQDHAGKFQNYSTFSCWDTFRAEAPLLTLAEPERIDDFIQCMLAFYQQSPDHGLPIWPLANCETHMMIGIHSIPMIYDAYEKGFRGFDAHLALQAMRESIMGHQKRQDEYNKLGWIPWVKGKGSSTSQTLELSYDDWCIGQMAKALGDTNNYELFSARAQNYTNVWDPTTRFFRSKNADGTYNPDFDPKEVAFRADVADGYFTEANAWQYMFAVQQDVPGMIQLYGGNEAFVKKLDELFNQDSDMVHWRVDVSGLIGQYAHGNEPCHHIAYLYAMAGAPWKTQQRVREIQLTQYNNTPDGICGNDDCGQISAWYVWSALGLYPVNPADGVYVIGSPLVEKAVIRLDSKYYPGGTFTIVAHNASRQNCYVQSARLNGQPLRHPWITHAEIAAGGTLELEMNLLPNKTLWAGVPVMSSNL
ncbi:MAG TPA: GH92 family glycosyl hydrolase [Verrucomicrobiae bacterium]|jgi:predicted alpha-1,2-mannosidase